MKKFILGFLTCLLLSTTVVYGASIIKSAYFNETLKLAVNGSQADVAFVTVEVEGEQYGRNYVSVADFVKALNDKAGLNATVDFDSASKTILVDSKVIESNVEDATKTVGGDIVSEANKYLENVLDTDMVQGDNGEVTFTSNGIKYITASSVFLILQATEKYKLWCTSTGAFIYASDLNARVLDNIPFKLYKIESGCDKACFSYDYYIDAILPLIK